MLAMQNASAELLTAHDRGVVRVELEIHDPAFAASVVRLLEASGDCEIVQASKMDQSSSSAAAPDMLIVLGCTPETRQRVRERRRSGWRRGLAVVAADTRTETAVALLDAGADDYLRLPLDGKELLSRLHALARRANPSRLLSGTVRLDSQGFAAFIGSRRTSFRKTSFHLFAYLAERAGQWHRTGELQRNVLQACCTQGASNVRWHVLEARRALGSLRWCVHSDGRRGYMFDLQQCGFAHCRFVNARNMPVSARDTLPDGFPIK
jgi:DNA-binding response OmpR family regulator